MLCLRLILEINWQFLNSLSTKKLEKMAFETSHEEWLRCKPIKQDREGRRWCVHGITSSSGAQRYRREDRLDVDFQHPYKSWRSVSTVSNLWGFPEWYCRVTVASIPHEDGISFHPCLPHVSHSTFLKWNSEGGKGRSPIRGRSLPKKGLSAGKNVGVGRPTRLSVHSHNTRSQKYNVEWKSRVWDCKYSLTRS